MASHNKLGQFGEDIARSYLLKNGYEILATNWRYLRAEVDIICKKDKIIVFVEVKSRSNIQYGEPESFLSNAQEQRIFDAANEYIDQIDHQGEIRFDLISIRFDKENEAIIKHFKDAFLSN